MTRLAALTVLGLLTLLPAAAALGAPVLAPQPEAPPEEGQEVEQIRAFAEEAAGFRTPAAPVAPVTAPLDGLAWDAPVLGAIAVAGVMGLAGLAFLRGGARFVTPAEVLENDVRQTMYAYLKAHTGANLKQLTDDLRLTTTNAIWHLRKLEEAGLIHSRRFNGYKVFYPAEGGIEARRLSLGKTALANANAQEVFEHVVSHPGSHQREIARALGVNHGTVRWHLKKLMDAELIIETRRGKASEYAPTSVGLDALREVTKTTTVAAVSTA